MRNVKDRCIDLIAFYRCQAGRGVESFQTACTPIFRDIFSFKILIIILGYRKTGILSWWPGFSHATRGGNPDISPAGGRTFLGQFLLTFLGPRHFPRAILWTYPTPIVLRSGWASWDRLVSGFGLVSSLKKCVPLFKYIGAVHKVRHAR